MGWLNNLVFLADENLDGRVCLISYSLQKRFRRSERIEHLQAAQQISNTKASDASLLENRLYIPAPFSLRASLSRRWTSQ